MSRADKALASYNESKRERKAAIRAEKRPFIRFLKWCWFFASFPFRWIWMSLHDWRTMIIFGSVFAVYSGSVWGFYLAAAICGWTTEAGIWLQGIGSAVWLWWLGPFSPFTELVIITTMGIKALIDKMRKRNEKH